MNRILVIKQTSLGDVLHATPFIRALKRHYPNALIDLVVDSRALHIVDQNPNIHTLFVVDIYRYEKELLQSPKKFFQTIGAFLRVVKDVRKERYDAVFDLQGLFRSAVFAYAARAKRRYAKGNWIFIGKGRAKGVHAITANLDFLPYGNAMPNGTKMDFYLPPNIEETTKQTLAALSVTLSEDYIVYAPYSRWRSKDVSHEKSKAIVCALGDAFARSIVVIGTEHKKVEIDDIARAHPNAVSLAGKTTIAELGYIIKNAAGVISVDSFPMHIACAFERPLVALFATTDKKLVGPLTKNSIVLQDESIDVSWHFYRKHNNDDLIDTVPTQTIVSSLASRMSAREK